MIVVVQAEATSAGANTVGIVGIRQLEGSQSFVFVENREYSSKSTGMT